MAIWFNKGITLQGMKRYTDALAAYDQAIAYAPNFERAWFNRGVVLAQLKRYREAIAAMEQTLKINPNNPKAQEALEILRKQVG